MHPYFLTFQYSSQAKIPIHQCAFTDRKGWIDRKQAYKGQVGDCSKVKQLKTVFL